MYAFFSTQINLESLRIEICCPFNDLKNKSKRLQFVSKTSVKLIINFGSFYLLFLGNHKDYNNRRHRELSSPDESIIPPGSRVPLSRSCSSPATATYGKSNEIIYFTV